jgi:type III secretion protein Q
MTALTLRKVDAAAAALRRGIAAWRQQGMALHFRDPQFASAREPELPAGKPSATARYLRIQAIGDRQEAQWDGWIRSDEWLTNTAPALAALATPDRGNAHAAQLFAATSRPLSPASVFPYRSIVVTGDVSGADLQHLPLAALSTPEATVWLQALPPAPAPVPEQHGAAAQLIAAQMQAIPATVQFLLGASRLSQGCLSRVGPGDVLLVSDHALRMRCNGLILAWYSITDEGFNVEELLEEPYEEFALDAAHATPEQAEGCPAQDRAQARDQDRDRGQAPLAMARIPVRLEFVLQQTKMTIGQLGQLHAGQLIGLAPDAEKQVLVLANGAVLGRGELVQMEDRLGVELIELYGGQDHAD